MNEIQEYNGVEAALSEIKSKYAGRVYDVTTTTGLKDARLARREVREVRTGLEKLRKEIKAPAWARCKAIDDEAKRITAELLKIEEPIDAIISAEETRVLREKEERARQEDLRVAKIRERIELFNVMPPWGSSAAQISARLREVNEIPVDATFEEFTETAAIAKAQAITRLSTLAEESRTLEAEQAKLKALAEEQMAKRKAEQEEHDRRMAEEREARKKAEAEAERARSEERARMAEEARIAREGQMLAEQAAEAERQAAAEAAERAARELALQKAQAHSSEEALQRVADIVTLWLSDQIDAEAAMDEIEVIVAANA